MNVEEAIKLLKEGKVVALPTETVYGLASLNSEALYEVKGRPQEKKIAVAIASLDMMDAFDLDLPDSFYPLAEKFWPGPLTLIMGGIGFRMPDHPLALAVLRETGPLFLTSANTSGEPSATRVDQITLPVPILDGGPCKHAKESTILLFDGEWKLLREGVIPFSQLDV